MTFVVETISNFWVKAGFQALGHGLFQGGLYAVTGGNFWTGFASGAISSIAASMWAGGTNTTAGPDGTRIGVAGTGMEGFGNSGASMIVFGTISGGAAAALTGGNFWQGAVTGLIVSGFNHYMHRIEVTKYLRDRLVDAGYSNPEDAANMTPKEILDMTIKVFQAEFLAAGSPKMEFDPNVSGNKLAITDLNIKKHYEKNIYFNSYICFIKRMFNNKKWNIL